MATVSEPFSPPWWLRNPHSQTIFSIVARRQIEIKLHWERITLPDGDFLDLAWDSSNHLDKKKPITLLLHGLEGSVHSHYAKGMMHSLSINGMRPVMMHFRGCSGTPNLLPQSYHSGETRDVAYVVEKLRREHQVPLSAVGFSLGGNVLLKWLGETGQSNPLKAAVAISVPFRLEIVVKHMAQGIAKIYQSWLLRHLKCNVKRKISTMPHLLSLQGVKQIKTLQEFDNLVTAPLNGFQDAHEYYERCSCHQFLPGITVPTQIIHAKDDPLMTPAVIPSRNEISASTELLLKQQGGHVGFISSGRKGVPEYWLDKQVPFFLNRIG